MNISERNQVLSTFLQFVKASAVDVQLDFGQNVVVRAKLQQGSEGCFDGSPHGGMGRTVCASLESDVPQCAGVSQAVPSLSVTDDRIVVSRFFERDSRTGQFCEKQMGNRSCDQGGASGTSDCTASGSSEQLRGVVGVSCSTENVRVVRTDVKKTKAMKKKSREAKRKVRRASGVDSSADLSVDEIAPVDLPVPEWRQKGGVKSLGVKKAEGWQGRGSGFWNSCSESVRQELIDSKARMHVAENERKAAEAKNRVEYLNSPRALADQVVKLASQIEKQAGLAQSQAIVGWAQTVMSSSAESVAKSAPSTVPSFDTYITDRSERERVEAEEADARSKKMDEEIEALRIKEEEARFQKALDERVREQVHMQVKQKIVEFEKQLRQTHTVIKKDMRTGRRDPELEHLQQIAGRHPVMATVRRV